MKLESVSNYYLLLYSPLNWSMAFLISSSFKRFFIAILTARRARERERGILGDNNWYKWNGCQSACVFVKSTQDFPADFEQHSNPDWKTVI